MSQQLVTVEQAAQELSLHPKTVLRYIRDNRLPNGSSGTVDPSVRPLAAALPTVTTAEEAGAGVEAL